MKERVYKVIIISGGLLTLGVLYGLFYIKTGIGIPCMFYEATGWRCPGCGITHMCVALMQGDIHLAIACNPMLFFLAPVMLFVLMVHLWEYIKTGSIRNAKWENVIVTIMIVLLLAYGVYRNIESIF